MAEDDIVINIKTELEGADEVVAKLKAIGDSAPKDDIKIKVSAEGADEAAAGVEHVGQAAEQAGPALEAVSEAAQTAGEGFAKVGEEGDRAAAGITAVGDASKQAADGTSQAGDAAEHTSESWGQMALHAALTAAQVVSLGLTVAKIGSAFTGAGHAAEAGGASFGKAALGAAATASEFVVVGEALAALIPGFGGVAAAAAAAIPGIAGFGVSLATLATSAIGAVASLGTFAVLLGGVVVAAAAAAVVAIGSVVTAIIGIAAAVAGVAERIAAPFEALNHSLEDLALKTGQSFASLQLGKAAFEAIGISAETFYGTITKIAEAVKSFDVGAKLKEQAQQALEAEKALLEAALALERVGGARAPADAAQRLLDINKQLAEATTDRAKAEQAASDTAQKSAELTANSLKTLIPLIEQIALGQKDITFDSLTKAPAIIDAVKASLKLAADAGTDASRVLLEIIHNVDKLNAIKIGAAFGLSEADVERIRRLGDVTLDTGQKVSGLTDILNRLKAAGVAISPETSKALDDMRQKTQEVENAWTRLEQAWSSTIFVNTAASISTSFKSLEVSVINFAASMVEGFNSGVNKVIIFFQNLPDAVDLSLAQAKSIWFAAWADMAEAVAKFFDAIGLTGIGDKLREFADSWRQTSDQAAKDAEAAAQRIRDAWQKAADAGKPLGDIKFADPSGAVAGAEKLREQLIAGTITADQYKQKLAALNTVPLKALPDPLVDANKGADNYKNKIDNIKQQLTQVAAPQIDWTTIVSGAQNAVDQIKQAFAGLDLGNTITIDWATVTSGAQEAAQQITQAFADLNLGQAVQIDWSNVFVGAQDAANTLIQLFSTIGENIALILAQAAQQAARAMTQAFDSVDFSSLFSKLGDLIKLFRQVEAAANASAVAAERLAQSGLSAGGAVGGLPMAGGGLVSGPGSETSDSILAWLSRGEFVINAAAVRHFGMSFFAALNALQTPRLAFGGMPRMAAIPAFASGGMVGGASRTLHLTIGGQTFHGLSAPEDVAQKLERFAVHSQIASTGRKPSWRR